MDTIIQELITALKNTGYFETVTIWNNQFNYMENGSQYSFAMPCAFLEVNLNNSQQIAVNYQASDLEITVHIGQDYYNSTNIDENFSIFALRDAVVKCLSNFKPTIGGKMMKTAEKQDFEHSNVYHYTVDYTTHWVDDTAVNTEYFTTGTTELITNI